MSKKIIVALAVVTILFTGIFAACKKEEKEEIYAGADEYNFVTDENGQRVLDEQGRFVVYATDANGEMVTDGSGENVTGVEQFEPILDGELFEDYGFKLAIPDGWKASAEKGNMFENNSLKISCNIDVAEYFYDDYVDFNKNACKVLEAEGIKSTWEEDINFGENFKGVCRIVAKVGEEIRILYFFENSGNVYKLLFEGAADESVIPATEEFCKAMTFKPYKYFEDITAVSKPDASAQSTESTTK